MVRPVEASALGLTLDEAKTKKEALPFKAWIGAKPTSDGWVLTYSAPGMDMEGKVVTKYLFEVCKSLRLKK